MAQSQDLMLKMTECHNPTVKGTNERSKKRPSPLQVTDVRGSSLHWRAVYRNRDSLGGATRRTPDGRPVQ